MFAPEIVTVLARGYTLENLKADALAGVTVATAGLPLAIAVAVASGATPQVGLYTAIVGGFFTSLLGGSRYQIGGPSAVFIAIAAQTVEAHGVEGLIAATLMAGLVQLLLGHMRFGTYINYIPHSVLAGFTAGVACILLTSQIKEMLGLQIAYEPAALLAKLEVFWPALPTTRFMTVLLAGASLYAVVYMRKHKPEWPALLVTILGAALLSWILGLPVDSIGSRFGAVDATLQKPGLPPVSFADFFELIPTAFVIAILGAIESLLSAVIADGMSGSHHHPNRELVGQGYANVITSLFGGLCTAGAPHRTAMNIRAGAYGPVAGLICAGLIFAVLTFAAPLAGHIPLATLGAVLCVVGWDMIDRDQIVAILKRDRAESLILVATFLLTTFRDVTEGVAVGVTLGALLFMHRMAEFVEAHRPGDYAGQSDHLAIAAGNENISVAGADASEEVMSYHINGPFFFAVASKILALLSTIDPKPRAFALDLKAAPFADGSAAHELLAFATEMRDQNVEVYVVGANKAVMQTLMSNGVYEHVVHYVNTERVVLEQLHAKAHPEASE